jgi:hypothetical protein
VLQSRRHACGMDAISLVEQWIAKATASRTVALPLWGRIFVPCTLIEAVVLIGINIAISVIMRDCLTSLLLALSSVTILFMCYFAIEAVRTENVYQLAAYAHATFLLHHDVYIVWLTEAELTIPLSDSCVAFSQVHPDLGFFHRLLRAATDRYNRRARPHRSRHWSASLHSRAHCHGPRLCECSPAVRASIIQRARAFCTPPPWLAQYGTHLSTLWSPPE